MHLTIKQEAEIDEQGRRMVEEEEKRKKRKLTKVELLNVYIKMGIEDCKKRGYSFSEEKESDLYYRPLHSDLSQPSTSSGAGTNSQQRPLGEPSTTPLPKRSPVVEEPEVAVQEAEVAVPEAKMKATG